MPISDVYCPGAGDTVDLWVANSKLTHFDIRSRKATIIEGVSAWFLTIERITGRAYFGRGSLGYVEKLYPFIHDGRTKYLSAFLRDYSNLGLPVVPVPDAEPVFVTGEFGATGFISEIAHRGDRPLLAVKDSESVIYGTTRNSARR